MVEQAYAVYLDLVFHSLSDPTRRDILLRVSRQSASMSEIAENYQLSFAGVAKHLGVLEAAGLIRKTRQGKEQIVTIVPGGLAPAGDYLQRYQRLWEGRLDALDKHLQTTKHKK